MKIHTTQNLSLNTRQQLFNSASSVQLSKLGFAGEDVKAKDDSVKNVDAKTTKAKPNYRLINALVLLSGGAVITGLSLALSKKSVAGTDTALANLKNTVKDAKQAAKVGDIKEKPVLEKMKQDNFLKSKFFEKVLEFSENEPVMQAMMSAFICILLRPLTIMALPNKKGKEDNMYASAHSISSGIMGIISTILIAQPFKSGAKYTMDKLLKEMSPEALKRRWPKLDIKSTIGTEPKDWKFIDGNKFIPQFKDVEKIPILKSFNDISADTYRKLLNADVDWVSQKGFSFNDVITKDGKSLYDVINWKRLGIIVDQQYTGADKLSKKMQKECSSSAQVLLQDLDKDFLEKIIRDADKSSAWSKLDINSVYENGRVVDFRKWKEIGTGEQWKLDLDSTYISSELDTTLRTPRISGRHRIEPTGEIKYAAYLKNGKDGALGTIVDAEMAAVDKKNEVLDKILTWAPDILTRPLVATATIALIPIALLKVFHLEKGKKPEQAKQVQEPVVENNEIAEAAKETSFKGSTTNNISFKGNDEDTLATGNNVSFKAGAGAGGKKPNGIREILGNFYEKYISRTLAKIYGKRMYESPVVDRIAGKLSKAPGEMTNHMATLGALLTSSVYMYQTLNKKDLDDDRKRTLAVNQGLCFVIPTICAYTVDKLLKNWTKKFIEYRYAQINDAKISELRMDPSRKAEVELLERDLGKKLKGVRTLVSLAIFSMIYRYIAPVLITPVANKIGERINERRKARANNEIAET